jgi:hypothetical protein
MSAYEDGKFVYEFARRTHENLRDVRHGRVLKYNDTALLSFLLAVFVLPQERAEQDGFMVQILKDYDGDLNEVVTVLRRMTNSGKTYSDDLIPPDTIDQLPKYLRNAISHLNICPESANGNELTHLLVWNRLPNDAKMYGSNAGKISFVARVHMRRLRSLAMHVLERLSDRNVGDRYEGTDPIAEFDTQGNS